VKLGFLTVCMADRSLEQIAQWAADQGFSSLELAAWSQTADGAGVDHLGLGRDDAAIADRVGATLAEHDLTASSLAYYVNHLDPDPLARERYAAHLRRCVDLAAQLGIPLVGTFIGRDPSKGVAANLLEAERVFRPLVDHAGERGVGLMIENCVMDEWDPERRVGNLGHLPELWEWFGDLGLGLNFDPSHLLWQGIDPVAALTGALPQVRHVHAKDVELLPDRRNRTGYGGSLLLEGHDEARSWRFRMPGMGDVDWRALLLALSDANYEGVVSIEHEDPIWDGEPDRVEAGLAFARDHLRRWDPLIA
jgi:sugar phosphate isomerase/epimerase